MPVLEPALEEGGTMIHISTPMGITGGAVDAHEARMRGLDPGAAIIDDAIERINDAIDHNEAPGW